MPEYIMVYELLFLAIAIPFDIDLLYYVLTAILKRQMTVTIRFNNQFAAHVRRPKTQLQLYTYI